MTTWIHSARFDVSFIFGGAAFSLTLAALGFWQLALVPLIFWSWVLLLEGPHFAVTWIRALRLKGETPLLRSKIQWSFVFFLIPAFCLALDHLLRTQVWMNLWGFAIFSWSLYHNTRQHYGFIALWARRAQAQEKEIKLLRWACYLVCYLLMAELFFHFKLKDSFPSLYQALPLLRETFRLSPGIAATVSLGLIAWGRGRLLLPALYTLVLALYYSLLFFVVARLEPFYSGAQSAAEGFLVVTVLNSSFHNIQYIALTLLRAKEGQTSRLPQKALLCLVFGCLVFGPLFWMRGEVSVFGVRADASSTLVTLATIIYLGIVGQHFFLDQYLWRSRTKA